MTLNVFYCKSCNMAWGLNDIEASNHDKNNWVCSSCFQPERLNPKDAIFEEKSEWGSKGKFGLLSSVCDSLTSTDK